MTHVQKLIDMLTEMDEVDFHCRFDNDEEIWEVTVNPYPWSKYNNLAVNFIFDKDGKLKFIYPCDKERLMQND